ncbi:MAG TPA: M1 family metallopeptidase [Vicinamibacterales bacterium]|nr:M1 family metallopeptidase [Vicinamibacterales bacterium]
MKLNGVALLAVLALFAAKPVAQDKSPAAPLSPRNANYTITARLDPVTRMITGSERIAWRNTTAQATNELQFHLYWNAWRDNRSSWMRERLLAGNRALGNRRAEDRGWIEVGSLSVNGTTLPFSFISPDDQNTDDRTVVRVALPAPVPPGGSADLRVSWRAHVPRTFSRTGAVGNFFFIAQWFPKLGVLEEDGWNCHQFHSATEFFSDFGVYDVSLTVPDGWIVGATGIEQSRRGNGDGTTTHRYVEEDVHDFTWTTSPDYLEYTQEFRHPRLPAVRMRLLLQPEHRGQEARHFAATAAALRYYGEWYGPYPYGHVTVIDPAWQSGAGGMEYPTLFTAGSRWLVPEGVTQPEGVTVHEAGHQFWYGIVANNEFEHAWLDEGLNTFSTARTIEQAFRPNYLAERFFGGFVPWVLRDIPLSRAVDGNRLSGFRPAARMDAQSTPTYHYWPGTASAITYNKTALWLNTLERHLGWDTLQRIMSAFFQRWAFRHPGPADFFSVANEVSGRDLTWFFHEVHGGSHVFDYAVDLLRSERDAERNQYETVVVVRRHGEAIFPVDLVVSFEDGSTARERWDGRERWWLFRYTKPVRAREAIVDPDRVLLLDLAYTNNSRTLRPRAAEASRKWALTWIAWAQDLLMTYGFFV